MGDNCVHGDICGGSGKIGGELSRGRGREHVPGRVHVHLPGAAGLQPSSTAGGGENEGDAAGGAGVDSGIVQDGVYGSGNAGIFQDGMGDVFSWDLYKFPHFGKNVGFSATRKNRGIQLVADEPLVKRCPRICDFGGRSRPTPGWPYRQDLLRQHSVFYAQDFHYLKKERLALQLVPAEKERKAFTLNP